MQKGKVVWIVTEGETDLEFYKQIVAQLRSNFNNAPFGVDSLSFYCAKGIGNFARKISNTFKNKIAKDYPNHEKIVFLCYDVDVFDYSMKPPIDRKNVIKLLKTLGAKKVYQLKADKTIEDFFIMDIDGIKNFLGLGKKYNPKQNKNGLETIKKMFKDANRTYFKGEKIEGLVSSLDLNLVMSQICEQLSSLCQEIGYNCNKDKCKRK
jgi:hypothetical protein